jgi:hypothetical protein
MQETMGGEDPRNALIALGERLRARTDIVVGGARALILTDELLRSALAPGDSINSGYNPLDSARAYFGWHPLW